MAVCGLLITLDRDPSLAASGLAALRSDPRFTVGERRGQQVAVALATDSAEQDDEAYAWLRDLPGVGAADLVYANFTGQLPGSLPPDADPTTATDR